MAILTKSGRTAMAQAIANNLIFMGWGRGSADWGDEPPVESVDSSQLLDAVGYRKAARVQYCEPDDAGEIVVPTGRFRLSDTPTNHLYLEFRFDFENAAGEVLRETSVQVGGEPVAQAPAGQLYFEPDEMASPGTLLLLEHRQPLYRDAGVRETFEFVVTF